ncbi:Chemotaxis protein CheW [bioreactor metagenome]|uniref:Chemotaxis protein CheW n=1 Tax=bioreactor metagenome TaxID=1076179 RepID=A0A645HLB5_9ZZZZ
MLEMPDYVKGIINLRGKIIPVMDIRLRFGKPEKDYNDKTCVIVIDLGEVSIGVIVDSVSEVLTIPDEDIVERPGISSRASRGYINNIGKIGEKVVLLIDCDKLLNEEELDIVSAQL